MRESTAYTAAGGVQRDNGRQRKPKERQKYGGGRALLGSVPSDKAMNHICQGWVERVPGARKFYLKTGGHSDENFVSLKKYRVPFYVDHCCENGVRFGYVDSNGKSGYHTWFPVGWDRDKIREACAAVMADPKSRLRKRNELTDEVTGWHDGVQIRVIIYDSVIRTCYPLAGKRM